MIMKDLCDKLGLIAYKTFYSWIYLESPKAQKTTQKPNEHANLFYFLNHFFKQFLYWVP